MARYITFRFDDGHIVSARKAAKLLEPDRGSFFIVSGFVRAKCPLYGDLEAWRCIHKLGHDVQPHSETHVHFTTLSHPAQQDEMEKSIEFVGQIHDGPFVFCFPYNEVPTPAPKISKL